MKKTMKSASGSGPTLTASPVIVVMLRQPRLHQASEMRSDPFWEFGSFGLTGCHQRNLMNPKKAHLLAGARLAFVQGGYAGFRLVFLTPPINPVAYAELTEARWSPAQMPFRYQNAPLVLDAEGGTDLPALKQLIVGVNRNGWMGRFASAFRTRREPLPPAVARAVVEIYEAAKADGNAVFARRYEEALPMNPPRVDYERRSTYQRHLREAVLNK
jgi:hypothetical protein